MFWFWATEKKHCSCVSHVGAQGVVQSLGWGASTDRPALCRIALETALEYSVGWRVVSTDQTTRPSVRQANATNGPTSPSSGSSVALRLIMALSPSLSRAVPAREG
eukprot:scaffold11005_cov25-Tisochrysis_lutea.AAC.1